MTTRDVIRAALAWLATYGLHSTLFLGAAWLLCALRPPIVNRNRERVWKLALVGGLLSASLQLAVGTRPLLGRIDWTAEPAHARVALEALKVEAPALAGAPASAAPEPKLVEHAPASEPTEARPSSAPLVESSVKESSTNAAPPVRSHASEPKPAVSVVALREQAFTPTLRETPSASKGLEHSPGRLERAAGAVRARWAGWVLAGWTAIGLVGLLGFAFSWTCLRRHMLGRERLREGPLVALFERLCARSGVSTRARLSVSTRIRTPFSTGFFTPEICLPRAVITDLTPAQQEALLAHELAHLVRRDPAWFGLSLLIERLFFFQPLNRLARRRLSELAEVACDDWAVRWTGARLALASCLTEVAGWVVADRPRLAAPPGLAGHRSRLGHRVERLLDDRRSPAGEPPTPWWPPLAAGSLALVVLAVPGVSATAPRAPAPAPRKTPPEWSRSQRVHPSPSSPSPEASLPTPSPTTAAPTPTVSDMARERGVLESELTLLDTEIGALRTELEARELSERFADPLARIETRMAELRGQHERVRALLAQLAEFEPPADGPRPPAAAPASTSNPRDSR